jgi:hypothetical protein
MVRRQGLADGTDAGQIVPAGHALHRAGPAQKVIARMINLAMHGGLAHEATGDLTASIETQFTIEQPGHYRLRATTTDLTGRSTVVWKEFKVGQ